MLSAHTCLFLFCQCTYSNVPNKHAYTFISGKVCLIGSIKVKRRTLSEINMYTCLFGTFVNFSGRNFLREADSSGFFKDFSWNSNQKISQLCLMFPKTSLPHYQKNRKSEKSPRWLIKIYYWGAFLSRFY